MAIIQEVGRRSVRVRVLIGAIYSALILGSLAMVYPFAIMVSGSFKSPVDQYEFDVIPRFWHDDELLFQKYVQEKYNEDLPTMNGEYGTNYFAFSYVASPKHVRDAAVDDWRHFLTALPLHEYFQLGHYAQRSFRRPYNMDRWLAHLNDRFDTIQAMNREWRTNYESHLDIYPVIELWDRRRYQPPTGSPLYQDFVAFKENLRRSEPRMVFPVLSNGSFRTQYIFPKYGRTVEAYNASHGTANQRWYDVRLAECIPPRPGTPQEWLSSLSGLDALANIRLSKARAKDFASQLEKAGQGEMVSRIGDTLETSAEDYIAIPWPEQPEQFAVTASAMKSYLETCAGWEGIRLGTRMDWEDFVRNELPILFVRVTDEGVAAFRAYLRDFYAEPGVDPGESAAHFRERYAGYIDDNGGSLEQVIDSFDVTFPVIPGTTLAVDYAQFIATVCPMDDIRIRTVDIMYADYLREKYASIEALEDAWGESQGTYHDFSEVEPPVCESDWRYLEANRGSIRWEFSVSNYRYVADYVLVHGRALTNTAILVVLLITFALTVNPIAAYALSRFELPSTYKILLFFMATMAFPAEVTMIPNFLLLKNFPLGYLLQGLLICAILWGAWKVTAATRPRTWRGLTVAIVVGCVLWAALSGQLALVVPAIAAAMLVVVGMGLKNTTLTLTGWAAMVYTLTGLSTPALVGAFGDADANVSLLNTFWALILPSVANGYSIFLLKGFFDSLPQNLYESAQIEGASEIWMFRNITVPLSTPILAVIALQTFTYAYTMFMHAFVVCPDEKMWTIMVYLYQLQVSAPQAVTFAALIIAAVPTLVVFVLAQGVIMRGIIIPVEK